MKRIIKENNNEIMARCNDPVELGEESLSVDEMQWMRNHQDEFFYSLGLLDTNERANYVPRLFVLGVDENGESKVFDLSQVDIQAATSSGSRCSGATSLPIPPGRTIRFSSWWGSRNPAV